MLSISGSTITLTRGDSAHIKVPILESDGITPYLVQEGDEVRIQVRVGRVKDANAPALVFEGDISIEEGVPVWTISPLQSTLDCKTYYYDAQITLADGDVCTYEAGELKITSEVTL